MNARDSAARRADPADAHGAARCRDPRGDCRVRGDRRHLPDRVRRDLPGARVRVPGAVSHVEDEDVARAGRDGHRARYCRSGDRARAAVPRADRRRGAGLPPGTSADRRGPAGVRRAVLARRQRGRRERAGGIRRGLVGRAGRDLGGSRHRRRLLLRVPRPLHGHLHLPLPAQRHREPEAGVGERADAGRGRALARSLGARDDLDLALGHRRRRDRHDRRHGAGHDRLAARVELRARARRDRRAARHDPEPRRDARGLHPRPGALGRGRGSPPRSSCSSSCSSTSRWRTTF